MIHIASSSNNQLQHMPQQTHMHRPPIHLFTQRSHLRLGL